MHIAFVSDVVFPYNKSGRSRRLYELAKRLSKKHKVHIYTMKWWDGPNDKIENNIHLHAVCKYKPLWIGDRRSIYQALHFTLNLFLPLMLSNEDVIDCDQYPHFPCYVAKLVSFLKRKPLIITWHEVWGRYWNEYFGLFGYMGRVLEWLTSKLTKHNIANSESTKRKLESISKKHVRLITPGAVIQNANASRKGVLYVGRVSREKNLDMFVKVARILKRENVKCTVIGYGPDEKRIKRLAKSYGAKIDFLGNVPDKILFEHLKKNKVFLSTSTREGFSIAVLEAMGSGMPPVVINHPNNAATEFVPKELVVEFNENAIAGKILNMNRKKYGLLSKKVKKIAEHYTWEHAVSSYRRLLYDALYHHLSK